MQRIKRFLNRLLAFVEFWIVYSLGKVFGISLIVRYLRNPNPQITVKLLRKFGATIGEKTTIKRSLLIDNAYEDEHSAGNFRYLEIGENCYIGDSVYFDLANKITLENNVVISGQVSFITHADCNRSKFLTQKFPRKCQLISVNNGAWICVRATILPGVTVGENSVVAANSLVKEDLKSFTVYAGLPAKNIKKLDNLGKQLDLDNGKRIKKSSN
ncbi:MAG: acyltransferase [Calothrix sp. MO_167.B42]|nr:acyltransferase [Calothrix sp. MO_167.B42]